MRVLTNALFLGLLTMAVPSQALTFNSTVNAAMQDNAGDTNAVLTSIDTAASFGPGWMVTAVWLDVVLNHTWVGDLAIELISPAGTELQLMARPGTAIGNEQRGGPFGYSANPRPTNPITFLDTALVSAETMGQGLGNNTTIPAGSFRPDAGGWTTDITTLAGFIGEEAGGLWMLRIGDYAAGDLGTLVGWNLHVTAVFVPEPKTSFLLALGCLGLAVGGRRRPELLATTS
jgi:subtilisin-like proprotein convertase family protein